MMVRDWKQYIPDFWVALGQTLYMATLSGVLVISLGIAIGLLLYLSAPDSWKPRPVLYQVVNTIVNVGRSIPFIIMIVILIPVTRMVIGTPLGPVAALFPLTVGFTPFCSRLIESNLRELDQGRIEAARVIGVTTRQFIFRILLPESLSGIIASATIILVGLVEGTAVAGAIGAGGVGDFRPHLWLSARVHPADPDRRGVDGSDRQGHSDHRRCVDQTQTAQTLIRLLPVLPRKSPCSSAPYPANPLLLPSPCLSAVHSPRLRRRRLAQPLSPASRSKSTSPPRRKATCCATCRNSPIRTAAASSSR
ncbi:ABC transporter permease [Caballeronia jiangsuensis]|uniref:ABC transporter permease n=1 Tax=Caballeronia jiangsuensis TaxID=1458357 RepID=A0ABW9CQ56_9BURK